MTNTKLLEQRINDAGLKKGFLAKQLGLSNYGFMLKINNKSEFKASEIELLCETMGINLEDMKTIFFAEKVAK